MAQPTQQETFGTWLKTFDWSHWATLTTNYELTLKSARRIAVGLHKEFSRAGDSKIFFAAEPYDLKEGYHLHCLIKIPDILNTRNIVETYQHVSGNRQLKRTPKANKELEKVFDSNNKQISQGLDSGGFQVFQGKNMWNRIQLEKYNPKLGAGHYLAKYITKDLSDYDFFTSNSKHKF